jgi:transcriptional regulator with XRE-family HTH domain
MFFSSEKIQRQAEDFKTFLTDLMHDQHITQEELGRELGVHQSTIAQWLNPKSDNHMPLMELANLQLPLLTEMLRFILRGKLIDLVFITSRLKTDGDISDELLKITSEVGDMAKRKELTRENIKILKRRASDLHELVHQIEVEIEEADKRGRT